ncbi:MAG: putative spermidine/putrescine transport system permease protein [Clostridia bacterium]|nr:binding-protein-dependent transport system inner rane component [Clostridiales bacterium]MDK2986450.1 putative spermidine/putrescine transport system permease protein [Clostridia bacterium]
MKKNNGRLLTIFALFVYMFTLVPLVIITGAAFGSDDYLRFPPGGFSLKWVENIFRVEMFVRTFKISLEVAVIGTMLALIVGIPAAYALSRYDFSGKRFLQGVFLSPVLVPGIVFGFSLLNFLIIKYQMPVYTSLLIGHTVIIMPYIIRVISSALENFDYSIEEAALSLGAGKIKTFFIIVLPNIASGVIAAFILAFINSFNNVPVSIFLTGPGVSTLPIQMMSYVEYYFDPTIAALSVILMGMTIILMLIIEKTLGLNYFTK